MLKNLAALVRYRTLIWGLVVRELKARYRGSLLGYFWSFLNPLLQLAVYTIVFTTWMRQQFDSVPQETYALFLFCGILPWTWFSSSLMESVDVVVEHGNLIRKLLFPVEVLPLVRVLSNMVHFLLGLPILLGVFFLYQLRGHVDHPLTWMALLFPLVVLMQLLLTCGFAFGLCALSVHFRDLRNILANVLMILFFASAIIYPFEDRIVSSGHLHLILKLNPLAHLMVAYQHVLYFGYPLGLRPLFATGAFSIVIFIAGYMLFDRLRDSFADEA